METLGLLAVIVLPIRELLLELIRLPELIDVRPPVPELTVVGFLLLTEMLDGLRVLEVAPGRVVTGRLDVTLLDGRTLRVLVLLELILRSDELRGAALLLELLRTEGLDVLVLVEGLLEREEVETFAVVLVLEDCRALGADEDPAESGFDPTRRGRATCCFLELLSLDLLLLSVLLSARPGSIKSSMAKTSVTKAILTF